MFNNVALDVCIGLVFIFLLYSLLATIVQEMLARIFCLRARMLQKAIRIMLQDRDLDIDHRLPFFATYFIRVGYAIWENVLRLTCPLRKQPFARAFFSHPTIKYLARSAFHSKPSYIGAENFSNTIIRLLRGYRFEGEEAQMDVIRRTIFEDGKLLGRFDETVPDTPIEPQTKAQLKQIYVDAQGDINRFGALLEDWFNHTMDRANGWYQRQTQIILLVIGFAIAYLFNVDAIAIGRILSTDKKAREGMVQMAISRQGQYSTLLDSVREVHVRATITSRTGDTSIAIIKDSSYVPASDSLLRAAYSMLSADAQASHDILGLGSPYRDTCDRLEDSITQIYTIQEEKLKASNAPDAEINALHKRRDIDIEHACAGCKAFTRSLPRFQASPRQRGSWETVFGWLITALAISLGAPFWFDLLNKLVKLRAAGPRPATGSDEGGGKHTAGKPQVNPKDIKG
jgi:hypothetical protein